jgi:hypothetical protein
MLYIGIFHLQNVGVLKHMPSFFPFFFPHQVSQETNEEKKMQSYTCRCFHQVWSKEQCIPKISTIPFTLPQASSM